MQEEITRLEIKLDRVLEIVVRLESRLEEAKVLHGSKYGDDETRFALENGIDRDLKSPYANERTTLEYQRKVEDWLEKHEIDPKVMFMSLEQEFGHQDRGKLQDLLQYIYMQGRWKVMIERLDASGHPITPGSLTKKPFGNSA